VPRLTSDDGRTLAWREVGSGPPLLCHPGGPGHSSAYFGDLAELARARTLLLLDPRGTGGSDPPAEPSGYGLDAYAADLELLREALGLSRLDLLGHSHGGVVAMQWAGTHPERVGRLVLGATAPRFSDEIRAGRNRRPGLAPHVVGAPAPEQRNPDAVRHYNEQVVPTMDLRPLLRRIAAPTLVILGEHDVYMPAAGEMVDALPDPTLVVIPGSDHFSFLEPANRAPWSEAVLEFLAGRADRA
jgi:pimeloyl-ACP methyl ester carboxylesterase